MKILVNILFLLYLRHQFVDAEYDVWNKKFKTCKDSSFCQRLRGYKPDKSPYKILENSINVTSEGLEGKLINNNTYEEYVFTVQLLLHSTIRFQLYEKTIYRKRFQPNIVLAKEPSPKIFDFKGVHDSQIILQTDEITVNISTSPFKMALYNNDEKEPVIVVNDLGRFVMEYNQPQKGSPDYAETFDGFVDSRPYGPMANALDFSFPNAHNLYGLGAHFEDLALKLTNTYDGEPYRLYNTDNFENKVHSRKSTLYGSVPLLMAHGAQNTAGVFWFNSAETWVDLSKLRDDSTTGLNSYFMSETGVLDVFLMMGPTLKDLSKQYTALTGVAPLPPYFSLGYHQSRWNYFTQEEVRELIDNFDKNEIPLDAVWLDIEYTDGKKYFTWDYKNFTNPTEMINKLAAKGRKLVVIIDPHIKQDPEYWVYNQGIQKDLFIKYNNGSVVIENCWPNESAYLDFVNPATRDYFASQYLVENFKDTTNDVFIWNDMNEPSSDGPERTMLKDAVHYGDWEHRDVHNIYSFLEVMSTYEGLMRRSNRQKRPFILTRSYFAGSQRYAAIWTGDNFATWQQLKYSVPMCLTAALCGISFCGADTGGFFSHPEPELIMRWYQLAAYLPFFREHNMIHLPRREPYYYNGTIGANIKKAIIDRQTYLPLWYTLFYHHSLDGIPVIRPLVMEFPNEVQTFDIHYEYLIGDALLIRAITEPNITEVDVYFPGQNEIWYLQDSKNHLQFTKNGIQTVPLSYDSIPVFVRGGVILCKTAFTPLPSALQALASDIDVYVAPNREGKASGRIYIDDGETFAYQNKSFSYLGLEYNSTTLTKQFIIDNGFPMKHSLHNILIAGDKEVKKVTCSWGNNTMELEFIPSSNSSHGGLLILVKKNQLPLDKEWTITFE